MFFCICLFAGALWDGPTWMMDGEFEWQMLIPGDVEALGFAKISYYAVFRQVFAPGWGGNTKVGAWGLWGVGGC